MAAEDLIKQAVKLRAQAKNPKIKDKRYALHEPVDGIAKGKAHKPGLCIRKLKWRGGLVYFGEYSFHPRPPFYRQRDFQYFFI